MRSLVEESEGISAPGRLLATIVFAIAFANAATVSRAQDLLPDEGTTLQKEATWRWPDLRVLSETLKSYIEQRRFDAIQQQEIQSLWSQLEATPPGPEMLDPLLDLARYLDPKYVATIFPPEASDREGPVVTAAGSDPTTLSNSPDIPLPSWIRETLQLILSKRLCQQSQYEEALQGLQGLDEKSLLDPSSWMFYQAVCLHHFTEKDRCLELIDRLLEREREIPSRFVITAKIMKSDLAPFKPDTLDEVARLMNDVERRLGIGRAGSKVQEREKEVVDKLDKLIEKIEQQIQEQRQQQQQAGKETDPSEQLGNPMNDSRAAGGKGAGDVDPKKLQSSSGWGDLPPAQRQEALQNITRDLPSHYREVIEAYFKRLGQGDR